ncbi:MAG: putative manganese transporter [Acidobacteriota bacterium]
MSVLAVLRDSLMITGFVFVMMLLVEVGQVYSAGVFGRWLRRGGVLRTAAVALLGTVPGCLGAFTDVTLYTHGMISFGTLAGAMIAASGDEAFVMLAMFPDKALLLMALLFTFGLALALFVDRVGGVRLHRGKCCPDGIELHDLELQSTTGSLWRPSLSSLTLPRASLSVSLALFAVVVAAGWIGPAAWNWVRWTLLSVAILALGVVLTVSEHFLEEHLFEHVAKRHAPRVFLWVFGVLVVLAWLEDAGPPLAAWIDAHRGWALVAAALVGIIPESGPHLVFVTLFAQGAIPFSVLAASSAVQDGHGMLPLLAESPREFVTIKVVNAAAGLLLGGGLLLLGV